jgi:glycosyltransferase involved in cell wall biosynthesis
MMMNTMLMSQLNRVKRKIKEIYSRERDIVTINPDAEIKGNVLISYIIGPFLLKPGQLVSNSHTNQWECSQIAKTFLVLGYSVDIISWNNQKFVPKRNYSFFIDIHNNLERLSPLLNQDCVKIIHITGAHWLFQNQAEYGRLLALQQRRGVTLIPRRIVPPSFGIEYADFATILGNQFTISTFRYAQKPIYQIPISTTVLYPWQEDKDYEACRNRFLWLGGGGMIHKGLDLVLEAFAEMPEYHLTVCGSVQSEKDFENAFHRELYQTPNIHTIGWIDVSSSKFLEITKNCIGLIYPSCSEGGGGSVVTCLHAGLIPIVSYESSVDVIDFGLTLKDCSIDEIKNSVKRLSSLSTQELELRAKKAWEFARENHTREKFSEAYRHFVTNVLGIGREN